jgi:hypothetical protein
MGKFIEFLEETVPNYKIEVRDGKHIYQLLIEFSLKGGAWAWSVMPFSRECHFHKYPSPSRIPDYYYDLMRTNEYPNGAIGWKGKIVSFTKGQIIRDQQRGYGRD